MKSKRFVSVFLLAMFSIGILADRARAWITIPVPNQSDAWIETILLPNGTTVTFVNYHSYELIDCPAGNSCLVLLRDFPEIIWDEIAIVDVKTLAVIDEFDFNLDPETDLGGKVPWVGFSSPIGAGGIKGGPAVDIRVRVTLAPGTTDDDLCALLLGEPDQEPWIVIGTDVGDADGVPTGDNQELRALDSCMGDVPSISEWGLIIVTVLAFTAGTILFGRRRRAAAA